MMIRSPEYLDIEDIFMKRILSLILILMLLAIPLCACAKKADKMISNSDGTYTDAKTGITYKPISSCYVPVGIGAEYKAISGGSRDIMLYAVDGISTERLLTTEDGDLFASEQYRVTDIEASNVNNIGIYRGDSQSSYMNISQTAEIAEIMTAYLDGHRVDYSQMIATPDLIRTLKLSTDEDPHIYYVISYVEYENDFIYYDVQHKMTVKADNSSDLDAERAMDAELAERLARGEFDKYDTEKIDIEKYVYADDDKYVKDDGGMYYYNSNKKEFVLAKTESEIPPNTQRYDIAEYNIEWSVRYNFGKYFIYNKYANICTPAGDLIHSLIQG